MKELPLNVSRMQIYVLNIESIYKVFDWLVCCVIKRKNKGLEVSHFHLENCRTSYVITRMCAEVCRDYDQCTPTIEEKRCFRSLLADMVMNEVEERKGIVIC